MKYVMAVLLMLSLSGCAGMKDAFTKYMPAKPKFPEPVKELTLPCPNLKTIEGDKVAITELLRAVVENYALYYDCSLKNEGWNKWYLEQKRIYENGGNK